MTDATLTPEIYGDFGMFLDQMGVRKKPEPRAEVHTEEIDPRRVETNEWYKQGKECPF